MIDFTQINYLKKGNNRQKKVYAVLSKLHVFNDLKEFSPLLAGTFPIEIDTPESDLDILCYVENHQEFVAKLTSLYKDFNAFTIITKVFDYTQTTVCDFIFQGMLIEIFGQNIPVQKQQAFLHMQIEYAILQKEAVSFKEQIIALKLAGYKTEPAFAKLLGLQGNPYKALLKYDI